VRIDSAKLPLLPGAIECVRAGYVPQGLKSNREFAERIVKYGPGVDEITRTILFDPQTAGGLLLSISAKQADPFVRTLQNRGSDATIVGEVLPRTDPLIMIV
jgi:selenide,water dikinase